MTSPVGATGSSLADQMIAGGAASGSTTSADNTQLSPQAFLQLLVAQLQYQDPSSPVDTSQFMNETATLTQVQTMQSNSQALTEMLASQQAQTATTMVGHTVTYTDPTGATSTGLVTAATVSNSPPTLRIGDADIALNQIKEVLQNQPATS
jgi:flagellar basal-body rod modification protein FlgD